MANTFVVAAIGCHLNVAGCHWIPLGPHLDAIGCRLCLIGPHSNARGHDGIPSNRSESWIAGHRENIELGDVTPHNIKQLKKLNTVVFPVTYNDRFYIDVLDAGELAKLAYYNDIVVGAVCCRIDTTENQRRLYIMTLGCLLPYRRLGIGTVMVNHILNFVKDDGNFDSIFL